MDGLYGVNIMEIISLISPICHLKNHSLIEFNRPARTDTSQRQPFSCKVICTECGNIDQRKTWYRGNKVMNYNYTKRDYYGILLNTTKL